MSIMMHRHVQEIEASLNALLDMANQDPNNVPVLLAMATGFMILKQVRRTGHPRLQGRGREACMHACMCLIVPTCLRDGGRNLFQLGGSPLG